MVGRPQRSDEEWEGIKTRMRKVLKKWITIVEHLQRQAKKPLAAAVCAYYAFQKVKEIEGAVEVKDSTLQEILHEFAQIAEDSLKGNFKEMSRRGAVDVLAIASDSLEKADRLDRAGERDQRTCKLYYYAADFFAVAEEFDVVGDEGYPMKKKYCKWRMVEIKKALNANQPVPPPPSLDESAELEAEFAQMEQDARIDLQRERDGMVLKQQERRHSSESSLASPGSGGVSKKGNVPCVLGWMKERSGS